ncbi:MAG: AAA family ATPase [Rhizobacter sp.]|nr:AAA family ATPase [Rhizobacter sp.]
MTDVQRTDRLQQTIATLEHGLLERGAAVRLALLAALAGEHVLLIGPPGTAKSELARRLHRAFDGARYFERLLTRFTTPEELFGPLSLKALEHDRYERLTDGYLPTASIAFLDEVFKANSAILNALLTLLNEREFDNGSARLRTPLISVIGATNEVPQEEALMAFYDRFLVRIPVAGVSDASFERLLALDSTGVRVAQALTRDELALWLVRRDELPLAPGVVPHLKALRGYCAAQQIVVSDRRWRQLLGLLRTAALCEGRHEVDALDLWLVPYTLAAQPAQVAGLQQWFAHEVAQAAEQQAPWLTRAVEAFEKQLEIEHSAQAEEGDDSAGKLALARSIGGAQGGRDEDGGMQRMMSTSLEAHLRRRYSRVHVDARLAQVDEVLGRAREHHAAIAAQARSLSEGLRARLWLPAELAQALTQAKQDTLALLQALQARLQATRAGFADLPVDSAKAGDAPAPIALSA